MEKIKFTYYQEKDFRVCAKIASLEHIPVPNPNFLCKRREMADEWDIFDKKVQHEEAEIRSLKKMDSLDAIQKMTTVERLINASVWAVQQGEEIKAVAALRVAVIIDKRSWQAYYNLAWLYLSIGMRLHQPFMGKISVWEGSSFDKSIAERLSFYENTVKCLEKALDLKPELAKGWCLLGQAKYYMYEYEQARVAFTKAIDIEPSGEGGNMARKSLEIMENSLK
jgi:tetratricopeptide (TPR) repeat protein